MSEIVDMQSLLALKSLIESEFDDLIETYLDDTPRKLKRIHEAVAKSDRVELKSAAHSLKGSSLNLSANALGEKCAYLEKHAISLPPEQITEVVASIDQLYEETAILFRKLLKE